MCGLAGMIRTDLKTVDCAVLEQMTNSLRHRGPDDEGYLLIDLPTGSAEPRHGNDTVESVRATTKHLSESQEVKPTGGLGWRRLAIIDPSPTGHQPMSNPEGTLWLIFNGEVYNYAELRKVLEEKGHQFHTATDTEVILHSYQEWGEECLQRFNGMWGLAIWDTVKKQLFCARDRFGVKPFYYFWDGKTFLFASEIKSILKHPLIRRKPNPNAVYDFLLYGLTDHTGETFFQTIHQIPPGHLLTVRCAPDATGASGMMSLRSYYELAHTIDLGGYYEDICSRNATRLRQLLHDCVKLRLRTDVPIGSCLSGGLDSSAIVTIANRLMFPRFGGGAVDPSLIGEHQKTFTAAYNESECDERKFANEIIRHTSCAAHFVFPDAETLWKEIERLVYHQEEPFGSTSIFAQWSVMKLARENNVTVLLDGQGGDELLAGYEHYYPFFYAQLAKAGRLNELLDEFRANESMQTKTLVNMFSFPLLRKFSKFLPPKLLPRAYYFDSLNQGFLHDFAWRDGQFKRTNDNLQERLWEDETRYNLQQLLRYEDRNSMAFSIEARVPFIDYRLVEYIMALPAVYKIHDGWTKYLLRRSMQGLLPEKVQWRKDKKGFVTPEVHWLRASQDQLDHLFADEPLRSNEFVDPAALVKNVRQLLFSRRAKSSELWRLISLELWMRVLDVGS